MTGSALQRPLRRRASGRVRIEPPTPECELAVTKLHTIGAHMGTLL